MKSIDTRTKIMYPKVKAEDDDSNWKQTSFCPKSNSLQSRISENDQEEDSQIYVAKIPKSYIPSILMPESESTEIKKRIKRVDIEVKQKPKASPILRPRAVVSSPDNDAMIGSINKSEEKKAKKGLNSGNDQIRIRTTQRKNIDTNVKISHRPVAKQSGLNSRDHK